MVKTKQRPGLRLDESPHAGILSVYLKTGKRRALDSHNWQASVNQLHQAL
jgi:hypothetical protein